MTPRNLRWTELGLLITPALFLGLGLFHVALARPGSVDGNEVRMVGAVLGFFLAAHAVLIWRHPGADQLLLPLTAMLSMVGLVITGRLTVLIPDLLARQSLWMGIGLLLLMAIVALMPEVLTLQSYKYTAAVLGLLLVAVTFVLGVDPNGSGARLWIGAGSALFQPSEVLKVLLVIFLAGYLEDKRELLTWSSTSAGWLRLPPLPYLGPLVVMWAVSMLLLVGQRDLGATLLFYAVFLAMLYVASSRPVYLLGGLLAFVAGAFVAYLAFSHFQVRVDVWLNPWARSQEEGYQVVQSLVALASGGLIGEGLGYGYPGFVPAIHTDFVIAVIGEELGLAGTLGVVALYMLLVYRGARIALDARHGFTTLLATGLTSIVGIQAVVILAGTIKLIPVTGITLPFISYGGSSIITNFMIIALLLRISSESRRGDAG